MQCDASPHCQTVGDDDLMVLRQFRLGLPNGVDIRGDDDRQLGLGNLDPLGGRLLLVGIDERDLGSLIEQPDRQVTRQR